MRTFQNRPAGILVDAALYIGRLRGNGCVPSPRGDSDRRWVQQTRRIERPASPWLRSQPARRLEHLTNPDRNGQSQSGYSKPIGEELSCKS